MTWTPLTKEPDDLELSLVDAIRAAAIPARAIESVRLEPEGVLVVARPNAAEVRAVFRSVQDEHVTLQNRQVRRIRFDGRAVSAGKSFVLTAHAVIDRASNAFLDVRYQIVSTATLSE